MKSFVFLACFVSAHKYIYLHLIFYTLTINLLLPNQVIFDEVLVLLIWLKYAIFNVQEYFTIIMLGDLFSSQNSFNNCNSVTLFIKAKMTNFVIKSFSNFVCGAYPCSIEGKVTGSQPGLIEEGSLKKVWHRKGMILSSYRFTCGRVDKNLLGHYIFTLVVVF